MKSTKKFAVLLLGNLLFWTVLLAACGGAAPPVRPDATVVPTVAPITMAPAIPEMRMLTLEYPTRIKAGDSDVVRLVLEVDDAGNLTATVSAAGNVTKGQVVVIPNLYETHNVLAEARLDMAGLDIRPAETVSETLLPGQKVTFYWSVLPVEIGNYKGTVWFYLHYIPKTSGVESRQAISAQSIEIEATTFFGMGAKPTRWFGFVGTIVSSVLGLPFLESLLKWIWKRLRMDKNTA